MFKKQMFAQMANTMKSPISTSPVDRPQQIKKLASETTMNLAAVLSKLQGGNITPMTDRGGDHSAKEIIENNNDSNEEDEDQF